MRFYTQEHKFYCGIDLHARQMYLRILDAAGTVLLSRNIDCNPKAFLSAVKAFRDDLVVAVECMLTWYWMADLCAQEGIALVLGHALYMRAIHGGKANRTNGVPNVLPFTGARRICQQSRTTLFRTSSATAVSR